MKAVKLDSKNEPCVYLSERRSVFEHYIGWNLSRKDLNELLKSGYRHFGKYYFRPRCKDCGECVPIRIRVEGYPFSRGDKRVLRKASSLELVWSKGVPTLAKYKLYLSHKRKFGPFESTQSYENYIETFYDRDPFATQLEIKKNDETVAVMHMDITCDLVSAVYCYYSRKHSELSLGRLAILSLIEHAHQKSIPYIYLGYYIQSNSHMSYKSNYKNTEVLINDFQWVDFRTRIEKEIKFHPKYSLIAS